MFNEVYDIDNLYKAFKRVKKASGWKTQTQLYEEDLLFKLNDLSERLKNGSYKPSKTTTFILNERGKTRCIESSCIDDRIVQASFCDNVLTPLCTPKLIYDNSASLKNRGTSHFRNRLLKHLNDFSKIHGCEGYILLGDYSKFFDNIRHDVFLKTLCDFGIDEDSYEFAKVLMDQYKVDVSFLNDEEYEKCMDTLFNSLDYMKIPDEMLTKEKYMYKSMAIGSAIAQIAGVTVPYRIDNLCKIVHSIKGYGRYMDDFYVIHESKEYLKELLDEIESESKELGLFLNTKKTQIVKLSHWFTILKTQYKIDGNGKVCKKPKPQSFTRERRRMKKLVNEGVPKDKILSMYSCWRGDIVSRFGECRSLLSTDEYINNLFKEFDENG